MSCHCSRDTPAHLCHGADYTCPRPAKSRLYRTSQHIDFALAGVQTKFVMTETWACDECWAEFVSKIKEMK